MRHLILDAHRRARTTRELLESCEDGADPASVHEMLRVEDDLLDPSRLKRRLVIYQKEVDLSVKEMEALRLFLSLRLLDELGSPLPQLPAGTDIPQARNPVDRLVVHTYLHLHSDRRCPDRADSGWLARRATHQSAFKARLFADLRDFVGRPS